MLFRFKAGKASSPNVCVLVSDELTAAVEKADCAENLAMEEEEEFLGDKFYDKTKCFFDNISSDLKPRYGLPEANVLAVGLCCPDVCC